MACLPLAKRLQDFEKTLKKKVATLYFEGPPNLASIRMDILYTVNNNTIM